MTSAVFCPGCGEQNTADMAFCIFCGAPLKSATIQTRPSTAIDRVRKCVACGQADSLNSQFCIFCGSRVEAGAILAPPAGNNGSNNLDGDSSKRPSVTEPRSAGNHALGFMAIGLAGLLGAGLGFGASRLANPVPPDQPGVVLPKQGLVMLTAEPHSTFQITSENQETKSVRFRTGKTGPEGDVALEDLDPGAYHIKIVSPTGKEWQKDVNVNANDPLIIGGPPDGKIFSK